MKFEISPRVFKSSCQVMSTKIIFQIVCWNFMVESKVISHGKNANICFFWGEKKSACVKARLLICCQNFQKQQQHLHSWRYSDAEDEQNVSIWIFVFLITRELLNPFRVVYSSNLGHTWRFSFEITLKFTLSLAHYF